MTILTIAAVWLVLSIPIGMFIGKCIRYGSGE